MTFMRHVCSRTLLASGAAKLCAQLRPGRWLIESGYLPPPTHDPGQFPLGADVTSCLAISLSSATLLHLRLGPSLLDRLAELGVNLDPLAGLALHELIVNAIIHGNLQVASGRSSVWADLAQREAAITEALEKRPLAARMVTVAMGWDESQVVGAIADEGSGYDAVAQQTTRSGCGRGLNLARTVGRLDVIRGGTLTSITMRRLPAARGGSE